MALNPAFTQQIVQPSPPPKKSGGMFGGTTIDLGRAIAGYLAGIGNPAGAQALQAMNERRREQERLAQEQQQYQRERADKQTDWRSEYDYKLQHPSQGDDEYTRALVASGVQPGTPEFAAHMATRRDLLENPPQYMNVPGVGLVQIPRGGSPTPPTAPVGKLTPLGAGGPASGPGGFHY